MSSGADLKKKKDHGANASRICAVVLFVLSVLPETACFLLYFLSFVDATSTVGFLVLSARTRDRVFFDVALFGPSATLGARGVGSFP